MDQHCHIPRNAFIFLLILFTFNLVRGQIDLCHDVYAPFLQHEVQDNCSLVCTLKLQHAVSNVHDDELAICVKNSSIAIFCSTHMDCRQYHAGAYCKMIPCFCKKNRDGKSDFFVLDPFRIPRLNTCIVSARYVNPDLPIFPFPWRTLIIVFTVVIIVMLCLVGFRCLSSRIRKWQAKRSRGETRQRATNEDNAQLFSASQRPQVQNEYSVPFTSYFPRGVPRIYRANPRSSQHRSRSVPRSHYTACAQAETSLCDTLSNQDKPPPYEAAVQAMPPSYEDVERALNEEHVQVHRPPTPTAPSLQLE